MKRWTAFCALFLLLPFCAHAAPAVTLTPLKGPLYVAEDSFFAKENSMVYVGKDHVTVIGATWTPATAALLAAEIKKITPLPITEVIDQNHDLDRTGGNAYFQKIGAKIIAIQATKDLLAKEGAAQIKQTQAFAPDYSAIPIVLPDTIVGDDFALQDGAIRGLWLGASHKPDDIFVWFPNEKVLYGGCALKPKLGNMAGADLAAYPATLQKLKDLHLPIETIIAGHYDPIQGPELIDRYLAQLAAFTQPPYSLAENLFDLTRPDDLGLKPAPGAETISIFRAAPGTDKFVNGIVLFGFKGKLYAQWQSSAEHEDTPDTHTVFSVSADGRRWSAPVDIVPRDGIMRSSGGWWSDGKQLIAYLNVWPNGFNREAGGYVEYVTSRDGRHWSKPQRITGADGKPFMGVIEQDLHTLPDGRIVTAFHVPPGLTAAPYYTDDPKGLTGWTRGEMANLPHEGLESREMEPAWFRRADGCLTMVFRDQANSFRQLASLSCDRGEHWSTPALTNVPDARQKQSAGNLPDGTAFLVNAPSGRKFRSPLVLTLSKDGKTFDRALLLRAGPPPPPKQSGVFKKAGYHYPKSVIWNGALWVGYADAKENAVVTRVPLSTLP